MAEIAEAGAPAATPEPSVLFGSRALHRMFTAFTYRDFRVQWFGACSSSIGTWTQMAAQNWMVNALAGSAGALYLGLDAFLQQLPIMLFTPIGGVLADRLDRRKILLSSQYVQMATAASLALLVYFGLVEIWHILALSFVTGLAQAFGGPSYQSLIPSLVDKKDLPNAVALNSIQFNVARVIGPLVFAATMAAAAQWGIPDTDPRAMSLCFALNAASFLIVVYALMSLHLKHIPPTGTSGMRDDLRVGWHYVRNHGSLMALIILASTTTFLGFAVLTFLPLFATNVFNEGTGTYSRLLAFSGAGSVCGALIVAWLGKFRRMGLTALLVQAVYGILIMAFAMSRNVWASYLLLFLIGAALMMVFSTVTSLVQLIAPNEMRGRVMSIYMVAFRGGMPIGSLVSGYFATLFGAPMVIGVNGALLVVVAAYFLVKSHGVREA